MEKVALLSSASRRFFDFFPHRYLALRREGVPLELGATDNGWAVFGPPDAVGRVRASLETERLEDDGEPELGGPQAAGRRAYAALVRLRRGDTLADIARDMPNFAGQKPGRGVSEKSAEIIVRSGVRTLLTHVLFDRKPDDLPAELWPPDKVRDAVWEGRCGGRRAALRTLRAWIEENREPSRTGPVDDGGRFWWEGDGAH